jgi:hypothetical protein
MSSSIRGQRQTGSTRRRGVRQPFQIAGDLERLLAEYGKAERTND